MSGAYEINVNLFYLRETFHDSTIIFSFFFESIRPSRKSRTNATIIDSWMYALSNEKNNHVPKESNHFHQLSIQSIHKWVQLFGVQNWNSYKEQWKFKCACKVSTNAKFALPHQTHNSCDELIFPLISCHSWQMSDNWSCRDTWSSASQLDERMDWLTDWFMSWHVSAFHPACSDKAGLCYQQSQTWTCFSLYSYLNFTFLK